MSTETRQDKHLRVRARSSASAPAGHPNKRSGGAEPPPVPGADYRRTPFWRVYDWVAQASTTGAAGTSCRWPPGLAVLVGMRTILRQQNLHDPSTVVPIVDAAAGARAHPEAPGRPQRRRHLQRPRPPGHGPRRAPGSAATSRSTRCCR